ncbi:MAG TPA: prolyl aminopeptidase [Gammaproteobacteria bacterium]|nr:prolyl aminopeptidase [Gammaproteobacteria bacterium]
MSELFPPIHENRHFYLPVDDLHEIYVEECGSEDGIPVVFLHGGPGAGCEAYHRQLFDPEKYRIILFDQRGCGRSIPHAELQRNTTQHLISDIEKIRKYFEIEKWVVAGGSWGSTLALAYAETHPEVVSGMIIRGIYFCTAKEIQWFYQYGTSQFYPDYWQDFIAPIPVNERDDLLQAYHKRLTGNNEIARMQAAKAWSLWEARTATLRPHKRLLQHFSDPHTALSLATLEAHYFVHNGFLEDNQLLDNADYLRDIPCYIIHGRYDMICPIEQAYALHQRLPLSELFIVQEAGHAASETAIRAALIEASNKLLNKI